MSVAGVQQNSLQSRSSGKKNFSLIAVAGTVQIVPGFTGLDVNSAAVLQFALAVSGDEFC